MAPNLLSLYEPLMMLVFNGDPYATRIDEGHSKKVAKKLRDYAKNLTGKQVGELNEYINE